MEIQSCLGEFLKLDEIVWMLQGENSIGCKYHGAKTTFYTVYVNVLMIMMVLLEVLYRC